jgi:acyl carrier protein
MTAPATGPDTLTARVRKIVATHLGADPDEVKAEASLVDDLGADSLDRVELVMAFETEFNIDISDDAAEGIVTFGDAVEAIRTILMERGRVPA